MLSATMLTGVNIKLYSFLNPKPKPVVSKTTTVNDGTIKKAFILGFKYGYVRAKQEDKLNQGAQHT